MLFRKTYIFALTFAILSIVLVAQPMHAYAETIRQCNQSPFCKAGYMDWQGAWTTKSTAGVVSLDGQVCVATDFNKYNMLVSPSYYWTIQKKIGHNQWTYVRRSENFGANGNIDKQCFDRGIDRGKIYRVQFHIRYAPLVAPFIHGNYTLRGYKTNADPLTN